MSFLNIRLLFHHHAVVYADEAGRLWMPSFIGRWLNALSPHIREIGLLMAQSNVKLASQDTCVDSANITLISLGPPGKTWDRITRMRRIASVCRTASAGADGLLIRGGTPRQWAVWKNTTVPHKAYLLVGEFDRRPASWTWSFASAHAWVMSFLRPGELRRMARKDTLIMVNAPSLMAPVQNSLNTLAHFVPTNSIQASEFSELNVRPLSSPLRLLFCARVVPEKGIFELLTAVALLNKSGLACSLDIIGPVAETIGTELQAQIASLNLAAHLHFHGPVPYGEALFTHYRKADIFVLPTYHEGFPHVLWEAAAQCCAIVTTRVGGIPSLLTDEQHALLVPSHNGQAIAEAVRRIALDTQLRSHLIVNAYRQVQNYTIDQCALKLVEVLRENGFNQ